MGDILVLGNFRQTVTVVRSLSKAGYGLILGQEEKTDFVGLSRHVTSVWRHPSPATDEREFSESLLEFLESHPSVELIFPTGENQINYFRRHMDMLDPATKVAMPGLSAISRCLDKRSMYGIAGDAGVPFPETAFPTDVRELALCAERIGYPCVVKPNNSETFFLNRKAVILSSAFDLERRIGEWPAGNAFLIVQSYVDGIRHNCHFFAENGAVRVYFEDMVLRTNNRDYTGLGVNNVSVAPDERMKAYSLRLARALDYTGVGCVQFLVEKTSGGIFLLEINPRLDANCALPYWCGCDFPRLAVAGATGESGGIPETAPPYPEGVSAYWMLGDVHGMKDALLQGEIGLSELFEWAGDMVRSLVSADYHIVWSGSDPWPALYSFLEMAVAGLRKFLFLLVP